MSKTTETPSLKAKRTKLHEEILFLEQTIYDYKAERKTHWKLFKNKIAEDIEKLKGIADEIPTSAKN